jgi:ferredoxin
MPLEYIKNVTTLQYDPEKCTGCELCAAVCPHGVFEMEGRKARLTDRDLCMECGACQRNCAFGAIAVKAGVGCAYAIIWSTLRGKPTPTCGE